MEVKRMKKKMLSTLLVMTMGAVLAAPSFSSPVAQGNFGLTFPVLTLTGLAGLGEYSDWSFNEDGYLYINATEGWMSLGYFAADGLEIGPSISITNPMHANIDATINIAAFAHYHIDLEQIIPFFGAKAGAQNVTADQGATPFLTAVLGATLPVEGSRIHPYAATHIRLWFPPSPAEMRGRVDLSAGIKAFF
jgi:hypothetical protein